jgi:hypothetical protein
METPITHYTPIETVQEILKDITFVSSDFTLEPCKGRENRIYNNIPGKKDWCEIEEGRDFFQYTGSPTKVITNPPFHDQNKKNICVSIIEHCLKVATDEVWLLLNNQMFNSLTPCRLHKYLKQGWRMNFIRILNIPCWYGRYFWICFKKGDWAIQDTKSFVMLDGLSRHGKSIEVVPRIEPNPVPL